MVKIVHPNIDTALQDNGCFRTVFLIDPYI